MGEGARISLGEYWKGTNLSAAERFVVLEEPLRLKQLTPAPGQDPIDRIWRFISWDVMRTPVGEVILASGLWRQRYNGGSRVTAGGDVITVQNSAAVNIASRSVSVQRNYVGEVSFETVGRVAAALRTDAAGLPEHDVSRQRAESIADTLERDSRAGRWELVREVLENAASIARSAADVWVATTAAFTAR